MYLSSGTGSFAMASVILLQLIFPSGPVFPLVVGPPVLASLTGLWGNSVQSISCPSVLGARGEKDMHSNTSPTQPGSWHSSIGG